MTYHEQNFALALIDIDGTICLGTRPIPGAVDFILRLREKKIAPVFFTNNSTRTPETVAAMLADFGILAHSSEVCTAAEATAEAIVNKYGRGAVVCYLGASGLETALTSVGLQLASPKLRNFDELKPYVTAAVIGLDQNVNYHHIAQFCQVADALQGYYLTNPDVRLPMAVGFLPGTGSLSAIVERATGLTPTVIGKPEPAFIQFALQRYRVRAADALVIGDNLWTDIAAANQAGLYSIQVRSGVSGDQTSDLRPTPNVTFDSVADLFL